MQTIAMTPDLDALRATAPAGTVLVVSAGDEPFGQVVLDGQHVLKADEPVAAGGGDSGPNPYGLLVAALGTCTSMTLRLYAGRKKWPLERVVVRLRHDRGYARDCADCEDPKAMIDRIERVVELHGPLDDSQRSRLMQIANQCPVHRTLTSRIEITTTQAPATAS